MRSQAVVITGASGFVGRHLARKLVADGHSVIGIGRHPLSEDDGSDFDDYVVTDLSQAWPKNLAATAIVHLAGLSAVGPSFQEPARYVAQNSAMFINVAEAALFMKPRPRVLVVSSGAVYDASTSDAAINEHGPLSNNSPYAVSKILVENLSDYYGGRGLDFVVARPFNHIGPGQSAGFLLPDLYSAVLATQSNGDRLQVGDLKTRRDYCDVRDIVAAYSLMIGATSLSRRLYNVSSMKDTSGEEILAELVRGGVGVTTAYHVDPDKVRPNDPRKIVGDSGRLRDELGWLPEITLSKTISDFIEARQKIAGTTT